MVRSFSSYLTILVPASNLPQLFLSLTVFFKPSPYSFNAQRLFTSLIWSTLGQGISNRRGLAKTSESTWAREIATLMRFRLKRKSIPLGISSAEDDVMDTRQIGASCP